MYNSIQECDFDITYHFEEKNWYELCVLANLLMLQSKCCVPSFGVTMVTTHIHTHILRRTHICIAKQRTMLWHIESLVSFSLGDCAVLLVSFDVWCIRSVWTLCLVYTTTTMSTLTSQNRMPICLLHNVWHCACSHLCFLRITFPSHLVAMWFRNVTKSMRTVLWLTFAWFRRWFCHVSQSMLDCLCLAWSFLKAIYASCLISCWLLLHACVAMKCCRWRMYWDAMDALWNIWCP